MPAARGSCCRSLTTGGRSAGRTSARCAAPAVIQLRYVTNRDEWRTEIERRRSDGEILICDRYLASSVAYGEAQGLDSAWLLEIQRHLPQPDLTLLLDTAPE